MALGDVAFCLCLVGAEPVPVCGWIVDCSDSEVVLGTSNDLTQLENSAVGKAGDVSVRFVRVPIASITETVPAAWKGLKPKDLPSYKACTTAWPKVKTTDLGSSGAELPRKQKPERPLPRGTSLGRDLEKLRRGEEIPKRGRASSSFLPPGGREIGRKKGDSRQRESSPDLRKALLKGLASGQPAADLMPAMMMALLLDKDRKGGRKKGREDPDELGILGGSDSDDSGIEGEAKSKGMRAVVTLNKLHKHIKTKPNRICSLFEKEVIEDLGIDFVRKQHWGKFKGIYRCAMMDVAVYEYLRNNQPEIAAAQVVQNLKAKMQSVLQGGDWSAAWLLTGLPDPLARREFAGSKEEMARLQKRVKEAQNGKNHGDEEDEGVQGHRLERSGSDVPLFPCMLPYPDAVVTEGETMGEGQVCEWWSRAFVNTFMAWGNFVTLGCPRPGGSAYEPRVGYLSMEGIRAFADKLLGEVREFVCLDLVLGRLSCDGKKGAIDALISEVQCTVGASYFKQFGQVDGGMVGTALPVAAERVAIPEKAGTVDPCDWLEPDKAHILNNLEQHRLPEYLWSDVVRACHRVPQEEEAPLARRLLEADVAVLVPESELPRNQAGDLMPGGLFCVAKNQKEDRLIFDRRPENGTMERLRWARLPAGSCFCRMLLRSDQFLRGSGDDLRTYYYMLKLPDSWVRFNAVGRQVERSIVAEFGGNPQIPYRLCFRVLGMGDLNACDVEAVLRKHGVLNPANTLHYGEHVPESDLWEGAYLDDLLIAQRTTLPFDIPLDGSFTPPAAQVNDQDFEQVKAAETAYEAAGLERAVHKAFRFEPRFRAWGAEVDGIRGRVGTPRDARRQVWMLLFKIVTGGWCSREVLQKVVGYLAFVFQYRREFYGLQHHVYRYIAKMPDKKWVRLPGYILDELRSCSLHLPFARWDMRREISSSLLATDATPSSGGAVDAPISEALAQALWKHAELKGEAVRLDGSGALEWLAPRPMEASRFASSVALCLPWRVVSSYHFRETSHTNLQEARALRKEVIRLAANPANHNLVILALNDSRVVLGAFVKGRSSSRKLNGILRAMIPHLVVSGISLSLLWVETEANVADAPSRFRSLPAPLPAPRWLRELGVQRRGGALPGLLGVEVLVGSACLTAAAKDRGLDMLAPIELSWDRDVFETWVTQLFAGGDLCWAWIAPPRRTFVRTGGSDGRRLWRPREQPEGDPEQPEVAVENALWLRALELAHLAVAQGIFFVLEHPKRSRAWSWPETQKLLSTEGVKLLQVDWSACDREEPEFVGGGSKSRLLTNAPWLERVVQRFPGGPKHAHVHPRPGSIPPAFVVHLSMRWSTGRKRVPLRHAALSVEYRHNLRESSAWLLNKARELGAKLTRRSSSRTVDRILEATVERCYQEGERLYKVTLGVLGLQRALQISGPLLRGTWAAIRGWRSLQPVKSRVPMSKYVLEGLLVVLTARALREVGRVRERFLAAMLASWICFEALLRPGEADNLLVGDVCLPDPGLPSDEAVGRYLCLLSFVSSFIPQLADVSARFAALETFFQTVVDARCSVLEQRLATVEVTNQAVLNSLRHVSGEVENLEHRFAAFEFANGPVSEDDFAALRQELHEALNQLRQRVDRAVAALEAQTTAVTMASDAFCEHLQNLVSDGSDDAADRPRLVVKRYRRSQDPDAEAAAAAPCFQDTLPDSPATSASWSVLSASAAMNPRALCFADVQTHLPFQATPVPRPGYPLHGRELAPFRVDGFRGGVSPVRPRVFRPLARPKPAPYWGPRRNVALPAGNPRPVPTFAGASALSTGPVHRARHQTVRADAHHSAAVGSFSLSATGLQCGSAPALTGSFKSPTLPRPNAALGSVVTSVKKHAVNWQLVLSLWRDLVDRHASVSEPFSGLADSRHKERMLQSMLSRNSDTTLLRYLRSVSRFFDMLQAAGHHIGKLSQHHVMDVLLCCQEENSDSLSLPLNMIKALRWYLRVSLIAFPSLYGGLFIAATALPDGERKEAMPLPLIVVVELERLVLNVEAAVQDRVIAGALLCCVWASLRFSDSQHLLWSSLVSDAESLRGVCFRTKTNRRGSAFGVIATGFLSEVSSPEQSWTHVLLDLLRSIKSQVIERSGVGDFEPDALFFQWGVSNEVLFAPLEYAFVLRWLRRFASAFVPCGDNYTLHSCKATLLSIMNQLLLARELRSLQGHHKFDSAALYSRDDVWLPLAGQRVVRRAVLSGWRPLAPQHRGGQAPAVEPEVQLSGIDVMGDWEDAADSIASAPSSLQSPCMVSPALQPEVPAVQLPTSSPSSPRPFPEQSAQAFTGEPAEKPGGVDSDEDAFDEFEFLISRSGIVHVQAASVSDKGLMRTACGIWSANFSLLSDLPEGVIFCKHKACQSALSRAA
ncbi:SMYD3 [Symbiodinium sp. CCMP2592]|nr:SMYD3 [Symbiodinium sp. CCMP2592]